MLLSSNVNSPNISTENINFQVILKDFTKKSLVFYSFLPQFPAETKMQWKILYYTSVVEISRNHEKMPLLNFRTRSSGCFTGSSTSALYYDHTDTSW